jgi:hypothetical protein
MMRIVTIQNAVGCLWALSAVSGLITKSWLLTHQAPHAAVVIAHKYDEFSFSQLWLSEKVYVVGDAVFFASFMILAILEYFKRRNQPTISSGSKK